MFKIETIHHASVTIKDLEQLKLSKQFYVTRAQNNMILVCFIQDERLIAKLESLFVQNRS